MINPPTVLLHKCKGNKFQRNTGLLFIVGEVSAKFVPKFCNTMVLIFALLCETLESKEIAYKLRVAIKMRSNLWAKLRAMLFWNFRSSEEQSLPGCVAHYSARGRNTKMRSSCKAWPEIFWTWKTLLPPKSDFLVGDGAGDFYCIYFVLTTVWATKRYNWTVTCSRNRIL